MLNSKEDWRHWVLQRRSPEIVYGSINFYEILLNFVSDLSLRSEDFVLFYDAFGGELTLEPLLSKLESKVALTRVNAGSLSLSVHPFSSQMEVSPYGYRQPAEGSPIVLDEQIKVAFVPGLAFDENGCRLGFGKGFYDRFLQRLDPAIPLVGVVPSPEFIVPALPREEHDVAMTHLATENRSVRFSELEVGREL